MNPLGRIANLKQKHKQHICNVYLIDFCPYMLLLNM